MEALDVSGTFFCFADDVHRVRGEIDGGSAGDTDFGNDVGGGKVAVGNGGGTGRRTVSGIEKSDLPKRRAGGVGVECVDAVVFGGHEDDVVSAFARYGQALDVEGLSIDAAVNGIGEELTEISGSDIGRSKDRFVGIGTGAEIVVVLCEDVDLGKEWSGCEKQERK